MKTEEAQKLLDSLEKGAISRSYYDMAWVYRAAFLPERDQKKLYEKIINGQKPDGSWGGMLEYLHDRVINTLSVVVALVSLNTPAEKNIQGAVDYLQKKIPLLTTESIETIGFELTFPSLLKEALLLNLDLPYDCEAVKYYQKIGRQKMQLIPDIVFSKPSTLVHSIEAFSYFDKEKLDALVFENGSLGNSPAATAFYIKRVGKENAIKSVEYLLQFKSLDWQIPSIYPFEIFEKAWVLYNFMQAGILEKLDYKKHTDYLWDHWQKFKGASISNEFPIIDSDDTAVVYTVLKHTGYDVDPQVFEKFEEEEHFRCFDLERNPSISANIHILDAIRRSADYPRKNEIINKLLKFLRRTINSGGFWLDKWQISPFYCTCHALLALADLDPDLTQKAKRFLQEKNNNGSWGTFEENGFVSQVLHQDYLGKCGMQEMWVDKGLYAPINVIKSLKYGFKEHNK